MKLGHFVKCIECYSLLTDYSVVHMRIVEVCCDADYSREEYQSMETL